MVRYTHLVLLATACLVLLSSCPAAAQKAKAKVNGKALFYAPQASPVLYTYSTNFSIPSCCRVCDSFDFSVTPTANKKGAVLLYSYSPNFASSGDVQSSFGVLQRISLDTSTGVLQMASEGATITFDLTALLPANNLQNVNRCRDRKTAKLVNNLFVYEYPTKKASPILLQGTPTIDRAIDALISGAKYFSTPRPACATSEPNPKAAAANSDKTLTAWVGWLTKVKQLAKLPVTCP